MCGVFSSILFLLLIGSSSLAQKENEDEVDFFKICPPSTCGSLEIRFPLRLRSAPPSCGLPRSIDLACSGDNATLIISIPSLPPFNVTAINYQRGFLTIDVGSGPGSESPFQRLSAIVSRINYTILLPGCDDNILIRCAGNKTLAGPARAVSGPIRSCSGGGAFAYAVDPEADADVLPRDCEVLSKESIPYFYKDPLVDNSVRAERVEAFEKRRELELWWYLAYGLRPWDYESAWDFQRYGNYGSALECQRYVNYGSAWECQRYWEYQRSGECQICESNGDKCGFSAERNQSFCIGPGPRHGHGHGHGLLVPLIAGTSFAGFVILLSVSFILFYIFRLPNKEKEIYLKVEQFLATYKTTTPTRYTFLEIKKITKRFRQELGQGGFGSVYKGELPNGIPVAVKMLEKSKGDGEEFINEVATIGRIHHVNIVRLLGFCSEGRRHALIYEYMPNESLEKFIFSEDKQSREPFSMEKLLEISLGIARGIEYLHQGCDQRILHFDIKPHNILLDHNFTPKISDFGLAKLCSRDISIITMTAARGTMGYIAPEIYSRNFGAVSYKSDVYSFGMLLLEMVSGRRTIEPAIENQSEVYFPEWIYNRLICEEDIGLDMPEGYQGEIAKKLIMVALWCIQWGPNDRPTMTRVIQLMMGNLESVPIPPKPFVSSYQN